MPKFPCIVFLWLASCLFLVSAQYNFDDQGGSEDNNGLVGFQRNTREIKMKLCGNRLTQAIMLVCSAEAVRGKRHAAAAPGGYPGSLSPLLMSVYRPDMDDNADIINDGNWEQWKKETSPVYERFQHINSIRHMQKRQASEHCCRKACSLHDLKMYCD